MPDAWLVVGDRCLRCLIPDDTSKTGAKMNLPSCVRSVSDACREMMTKIIDDEELTGFAFEWLSTDMQPI